MGYEIKRGKHISVKGGNQKKFLRFRSLGAGYREEDLERVFSGETKHTANPKQQKYEDPVPEKSERKIDMLLDIQAMIAKGKGPGNERWAKVHNIKQMAQTLLFLDEHDLRDFDKLTEKASEASTKFGDISKRQKELEAHLAEIAALKKHIINYSKTRETYAEYRKSGYSKKFFEEHREEIALHKAAKEEGWFSEFKIIAGKIKNPVIRDTALKQMLALAQKDETFLP